MQQFCRGVNFQLYFFLCVILSCITNLFQVRTVPDQNVTESGVFFLVRNIDILLVLRSVHMERFAYVCKFCIYAKFAYVCKSLHVYAFTHVCKICTYAKVGKFAPASDQVQISFCVYANFAYMQI